MSKYLVIWATNQSEMSANPEEAAKILSGAKEWVQQNIDKGFLKSWGAFLNVTKGYGVWECDPVDLYKENQKFTPYFTCEIHEVLSVDEIPQA